MNEKDAGSSPEDARGNTDTVAGLEEGNQSGDDNGADDAREKEEDGGGNEGEDAPSEMEDEGVEDSRM